MVARDALPIALQGALQLVDVYGYAMSCTCGCGARWHTAPATDPCCAKCTGYVWRGVA